MNERTQPISPSKMLLSVNDVARLVGVSVRTVRRMLSAGLLPAEIRLNRTIRWRFYDIANWIDLGCPDRWAFEAARRNHASGEPA